MAPPLAAKNFEQRQPITVTLRMICNSYSPTTCLRELLQNADDAGATEIEYVLDTTTHTQRPLLHPDLDEYMGPALLSRNNAVFRDEDFASLSSVGDSAKQNDPEKCGKFGQGFNSVFHWTDGPWIYSRNWLLLLDPHHSWSRDQSKPGGPAWDVIENLDCQEINNHLKTFELFGAKAGQVLDETYIRLPLRTAEQAAKSDIKKTATLIEDIKQILAEFCKEVKEGGLLFLKHIRKVVVKVDQTLILNATIVEDNVEEAQTRDGIRVDFRQMYASTASGAKSEKLSRSFQTKIKYENSKRCWCDTYQVQHLMARSCGDSQLDLWAKDLKLFPWVAVAAPLDIQGRAFVGRLFSTLILPMVTPQPVHLHGLFAIAPDRARLGYESSAVQWNTRMFDRFISTAYVELLDYRKEVSCQAEKFSLWPSVDTATNDPWTTIDNHILRRIIAHGFPVWCTAFGTCVKIEEGFLTTAHSEGKNYASALAKAHLPIIKLKKPFLQKAEQIARDLNRDLRMMTPAAVRSFLRSEQPEIPVDSAALILEFCLLDTIHESPNNATYKDLDGVRIFPTLAGNLSAPTNLILPRDTQEQKLFFTTRPAETVDLSKIFGKARDLLSRNIKQLKPLLRRRSMQDLTTDWPLMYSIPPHPSRLDAHTDRQIKQDSMLKSIWVWLCDRCIEEKNEVPTSLYDLWLVPLKNAQIRQLAPKSDIPTLVIQKYESLFQLLSKIGAHSPEAGPTILDEEVLTDRTVVYIRKDLSAQSEFNLTVQDHLEGLVDWVVAAKSLLSKRDEEEKKMLLAHLDMLVHRQYGDLSERLTNQMCQLSLFSTNTSPAPYECWRTVTGSLNRSCKLYELPAQLSPIPDIEGLSFCSLSDPHERSILEQLGLMEKMSNEYLLTHFLLPWMHTAKEKHVATAKRNLVDWIFLNSKAPSKSWHTNVLSHPIIPLSVLDSEGRVVYARLKDVVDPMSAFSKLYFDDEGLFPNARFYQKHKLALMACGISDGVFPDTPMDRAKVYASHEPHVITDKVECLFGTPLNDELFHDEDSVHKIRTLSWIPAVSIQGIPVLLSPNMCRGVSQSQLVDKVWGTTSFSVKRDWEKLLGWDQDIPNDVLLSQLNLCIESREKLQIDRLLRRLALSDPSILLSKPCILGSQGDYHVPQKVFYPGTPNLHLLAPHLDRVDGVFAKTHKKLLNMLGVQPTPSMDELRGVQNSLAIFNQDVLSTVDLDTAVAVLEVATRLCHDPARLANLLIPDTLSILRPFADIVHGDCDVSGDMAKFNFTHPSISKTLIGQLAIENSYARAARLDIEIEDEDGDEFVPRETLQTIIVDTLGRYSQPATFNEYLANAEDAGATRISWTLDEYDYRSDAGGPLLDPALKPYLGPALIVANDEVFQEADWLGFKDIGQGGKTNDATTTGMFGRGALSMYHFCDVPMVLSAGYLLILDPQQHCLPKNKHWRRKVGVKLSLEKVRKHCPGQLSLFHGLHGYHKDMNHYEGTIFRFPLRTDGNKSFLIDVHQRIDLSRARGLLEEYFEVARSSLLFLHSVNSITFSIRGEAEPRWSVTAHRLWTSETAAFGTTNVTVVRGKQEIRDEWRIGLLDLESSPPGIFKVGKGASKLSECGIAACLRREEVTKQTHQAGEEVLHKSDTSSGGLVSTTGQDSGVFCKLPTTTASWLPVSIHASFAITGDRKTIPFLGAEAVAKWNNWLLTESIPEFYIRFLTDLAPQIGPDLFRFWPKLIKSDPEIDLSSTVAASFWNKVTHKNHILDKLYPLADKEIPSHLLNNPSTDLKKLKGRKPRTVYHVEVLENAHFDLLEDDVSMTLRPLFNMIGLHLVRPQRCVEIGLQDMAPPQKLVVINEHFLSQVFKSEMNCVHLETFLASFESYEDKARVFSMLLNKVIPKNDGQDFSALQMLDGCRILPRPKLDAPLGLLKHVKDTRVNKDWHLVGTQKEQLVFSFAQERLVCTQIPVSLSTDGVQESLIAQRWSVQDIMKGSFNIRKLELEDVGTLLKLPQSPTKLRNASDERDKWTVEFWSYLNSKLNSPPAMTSTAHPLEQTTLWDQAIYRTKTDQGWQYVTPQTFESGPYIVRPNDQDQRKLCALFPKVVCMDPRCLPKHLVSTEESLNSPESFARFLRALSRSTGSTATPTRPLLSSPMPLVFRDILRSLLLQFLDGHVSKDTVPEKALIRILPVWPRVQRSETETLPKSLSADEAYFCKHAKMLKPHWIRDLKQFVEPSLVKKQEANLRKLNITLLSADDFWPRIKKYLPESLVDGPAREEYLGLINYMRLHLQVDNNLIPPAPDGSGKFCTPSSLYDHDDAIFKAAFYSEQAKRFVHPDLRGLRNYWLSIGLRTRPATQEMSSEDYLQSALALDRQWKPNEIGPRFKESAAVVSRYLQFDKAEFQLWPSNSWARLSKVRMFDVRKDLAKQRRYRKSRMSQLAMAQSHCALEDAGQIEDIRVIWSQVKFLKAQPANAIFGLCPQGSSPQVTTVFEHLNYMTSNCKTVSQEDTSEFLEDIKACYDYLQKNIDETKRLKDIHEASVWFNLDSTRTEAIMKQDLLPNLISARFICLNAPDDIGSIKVAKNFLIPYEKLLKSLGCKSVLQPEYEASELSIRVKNLSEASPMAKSLSEICKFRDRAELTDVTFLAEGQRKKAHKVFLAAVSDYCKAQFLGPWGEILKEQPVIELDDIEFITLSKMVDFAYTGVFVEPQVTNATPIDEIADILDDLLDLLTGSNRWLMPRLHEKVEAFMIAPGNVRLFVRVDNVGAVMERAESSQAATLLTTCQIFRAQNLEFVESYEKEEAED